MIIKSLQTELKNNFNKPIDSIKNLELLSNEIHLSVQTLRRFFGKIDKDKGVSKSSLNIICQYLGYLDWEDFQQQKENPVQINEADLIELKGCFPFFEKFNEYKINIRSTPGIWDIMNDYSLKVFQNKETIEYTYRNIKQYAKTCEVLFSTNPCYNFCTQRWYRNILQEILNTDVSIDVRVSMNGFLAYSAFLSLEYDLAALYITEMEKHIGPMREKYVHFTFPEMRYCIAQLVKLKIENKPGLFFQPIESLLKSIEINSTDKEYATFSSKVYIANALVWLQDFELAKELINSRMYKTSGKFHWEYSNCYIDSSYVFLEPTANLINTYLGTNIQAENKPNNTCSLFLKKDYIHLHNLLFKLNQVKDYELKRKIEIKKEIDYYVKKTGIKQAFNLIELLE